MAYAESLTESLDRSFDVLWQGLLGEVQGVVSESLNEFLRDMELEAVDVRIDAARPATDRRTSDGPTLSRPGFDLTGEGVRALTLSWAVGGDPRRADHAGRRPGGRPHRGRPGHLETPAEDRGHRGPHGATQLCARAIQQVAGDISVALSQFVELKRAEVEGVVDSEIAAQRKDLNRRSAEVTKLRQQDDDARAGAAADARSRIERLDRIIAELRAAAPAGGAR